MDNHWLTLVRWAVLFIWLVWLAVYWRGGPGLVKGLLNSFRSSLFRYDGLLILGIVLFSTVMLWSGVLITVGAFAYPQGWSVSLFTWAGAALILTGAAGTMVCRYQLGEFWNVKAELYENHQVVDRGLYRMVRHPIYAFACLKTAGTLLVFMTWWTVLAGLLVIACYTMKALSEERLLENGLPGYAEYQQRVRYRIAPWIW